MFSLGTFIQVTPIALMHTPHLDSHKHPRTDGGAHAPCFIGSVGFHTREL